MATATPKLEAAELFYGKPAAPEGQTEGKPVATEDDQESQNLDTPDEDAPEGADDSEAAAEDTQEDEAEDVLVVDIDGTEVTFDEIKTWRDGHLMQSDYTRKTQALAEQRKTLEAKDKEVDQMRRNLVKDQAALQVLIEEDKEINWKELREDDPEEYIRLKERADKRKEMAAKIKSEAVTTPSMEEIDKQRAELFKLNPSWMDDKGEITKQMEDDSKLLESYWNKEGFTQADVSQMTNARYINACLKAAKYDALQKKAAKLKKAGKTAPVVTRPKAGGKVNSKPKTLEEIFYGS